MKNKYFILGFIILSPIMVMSFSNSNNSKFYYAYNEKVILSELDNKLIVRYKQNKKSDKTKLSLNLELSNKPIEWKDDSTCIITLGVDEKERLKSKILNQTDVKTCNSVYAINTGLEMGVTDEFLVKFNENVSQTEIDKLHKKYGVKVVKTTDLYQLLKVPDGTDALQIANMYQESGLTRFSYPNFYSKVELHQVIPNDPYFINQFALNNTGQVFTDGHSGTADADIDAPEAWNTTTGNNNIIIAVLDEGVTADHPDLPNTRQVRLNGSNFADGDANNPSPTGNSNHGNACAGTIGATQNNNQGISGIAPNCRIMPIRIFNSNGTGITPDKLADAIDFARTNGASIISNSWGYPSDNPDYQPVIKDAIIAATTQGRNGLGCVVVFSAGNNLTNNGYVHFPSNVDVSGVLTVGASDRYDLKAFYSPLGNPSSLNNQLIDIVAPSHRAYSAQIAGETYEAWSIDIPGSAGWNSVHETDGGNLPIIGSILPNTGVNNLDYTGRFGGTSYACPQVAGVAALMLSINPNLTQQQVFDILTTNADKVGGYTYTSGRSNELGFGRLNAYRAVSQVASISGPSIVCPSGATFTINNLPPFQSIEWTCTPNLAISSGQDSTICNIYRTGGASGFGSGFVNVDITTSGGTIHLTKYIQAISAPEVSIVNPEPTQTTCLNTEKQFQVSVYGFCQPYTYKWFINDQEAVGTINGENFYYTFNSTDWSDSQSYTIFCRVYFAGDSIDTAPFNSSVKDCSQPITAAINGSSTICLNSDNHWTATVSGGSGNYVYFWAFNGLSYGGSPTLDYYFDESEWGQGQQVRIDLQVWDAVTYEGPSNANTIYAETYYCSGFSVQVYPNPSSDYVNISVSENTSFIDGLSSGKNDIEYSGKNKLNNKKPFSDEVLTYTISNIYGSIVFQKRTMEKNLDIPVSNYYPGNYILSVASSTEKVTKHIIIR